MLPGWVHQIKWEDNCRFAGFIKAVSPATLDSGRNGGGGGRLLLCPRVAAASAGGFSATGRWCLLLLPLTANTTQCVSVFQNATKFWRLSECFEMPFHTRKRAVRRPAIGSFVFSHTTEWGRVNGTLLSKVQKKDGFRAVFVLHR